MGNNCCQKGKSKKKNIALLLVGLDNAGKSVTAKGLAGEKIDSPVPTMGFNVIQLHYDNYDVRLYDLGGSPNIRGIWHKYFTDVHGVIFVIDSTDLERFKEVQEVLEEMLSHEKISGKPLLILANKQDQVFAIDEIDLIEYLEIEKLANKYCCPTLVQSCAANESYYNKIEPGIQTGYDWLMNYISRNFDQLDMRVQIDVLEQSIKEKNEMLEKIKRMKEEQELEAKKAPPPEQNGASITQEQPNPTKETKPTSENVQKLNVLDFYPSPERTDSNSKTYSSSSSSSKSFPSVYHVSSQCFVESEPKERPKSAVQIVKHQLQLSTKIPRSHSAKNKSNKTVPYNLYDQMPNSAREYRPRSTKKYLRSLKSADDSIFTISGSKTGLLTRQNRVGPGGDYSAEIFEIEPVKKLTPVKNHIGNSSASNSTKKVCNQCGDWDAITVVDID